MLTSRRHEAMRSLDSMQTSPQRNRLKLDVRPAMTAFVAAFVVVGRRLLDIETTTYVRNIFKYCAACKLLQQTQAASAAARQQVTGPK